MPDGRGRRREADLHERALAWLIALTIAGYPLLAAVLSIVTPEIGSWPSAAYRLGVGLLSLVVFFTAGTRWTGRDRLVLFLFAAFWMMYATRIFYEYGAGSDLLGLGLVGYVAYTLLFAVLPALGAIGAQWTFAALERAAVLSILLGILALVAGGIGLLTAQDYSVYGRAEVEKLNPILLGKLAAAIFVIAIAHRRFSRHSAQIPGRMLIALLALVVLVIAASKGPVVSLLLGLAFWAMSTGRNAARLITLCLVVLFLVIYVLPSAGIDMQELSLFERFGHFLGDPLNDPSTVARLLAYHSAMNQFLGSPIVGDALFDRVTGYYPHNALLETAMAMGVAGLVPLIALLFMALSSSIRAFSIVTPSAWLHLLAVQAIIGAMFSGGLYTATWFFFVMAAIQLRRLDQAAARVAPRAPRRPAARAGWSTPQPAAGQPG